MPASVCGTRRRATLIDRGEPVQVRALRVADGTLQALGVQPMRGRWFTKEEYGPAADGPERVILSYAFWQRRFGGDEAALGRELSMEAPTGSRARPLAGQWQVVGIMPRGFRFLDMAPQPDVIVAMRLNPAQETINSFSYDALARLAPGATAADAPPISNGSCRFGSIHGRSGPAALRKRRSRTGESLRSFAR